MQKQRIETPSPVNTGRPTHLPQPYDGFDRTNTGESTAHVNKPHTAPPIEIKRTSELKR